MICLYCGNEFETSRLTARYCCDDCKTNARKERNATPSKERNKKSGKRTCAICGKSLEGYSPKARYCGAACKQEAYRRRKARKNVSV